MFCCGQTTLVEKGRGGKGLFRKGKNSMDERSMSHSAGDASGLAGPLAKAVLDSLSAHIAILDARGIILETNRAWRRYAVRGGMPEGYTSVGENYLAICEVASGDDSGNAAAVAEGIRAVLDHKMEEFRLDYPCHSPSEKHWYYLRALRMEGPGAVRLVVSHEEITELKLAQEKLEKNRQRLKEQKASLEEANIALKVLLKQRESDREELERRFLNNVKDLVLPYVEKLRQAPLKAREKTLAEIVETHLKDIISPLLQRLSNANILLTPQEMHVAALVKDGKTSKEIAQILNVSETTVHFHRKNLRDKFGLKNKRQNLRVYLLSLSR